MLEETDIAALEKGGCSDADREATVVPAHRHNRQPFSSQQTPHWERWGVKPPVTVLHVILPAKIYCTTRTRLQSPSYGHSNSPTASTSPPSLQEDHSCGSSRARMVPPTDVVPLQISRDPFILVAHPQWVRDCEHLD